MESVLLQIAISYMYNYLYCVPYRTIKTVNIEHSAGRKKIEQIKNMSSVYLRVFTGKANEK